MPPICSPDTPTILRFVPTFPDFWPVLCDALHDDIRFEHDALIDLHDRLRILRDVPTCQLAVIITEVGELWRAFAGA